MTDIIDDTPEDFVEETVAGELVRSPEELDRVMDVRV